MAKPPSRSSRAVNPAQLLSLFLAFVLVAATGGVLTAGLVMPMVAAVGATANASTELFDELPEDLGSERVSEQSRMYAADGTLLTTYYAQNRIVVALEEISPHMADAVIAIEDHRFYEHGGVDPEGLMRAAVTNLTSNTVQGGSTLTQQYVKNVLIEAGQIANDPEAVEAARAATLGRKLREAKLAIALERVRSKDEILEGYLNIAQFGPSQYGVEVAARYFFNKSAADLNIAESALLAGVTQSPARWNPQVHPENAQVRRDRVLSRMFAEDFITQEEYDEAVATNVEDMLEVTPTPTGCGAAGHAAYFCDFVTSIITNDPAFGETEAERRQLLLRGGLEIHTTIDLDMQEQAHQTAMEAIPADDPSGVSTAISTVEPGTGEIKAMAQNTDYGRPAEDATRNTEVNFNVDRAFGGGGGFQTGSTFKVYVLAEWLRQGNTLADRVDGSQGQEFPRESWNFSCAPDVADDYEPRNIEGIGTGMMSVQEATTRSVNTAFVDMANQMDVCGVDEIARATGVHVGTGTDPVSGRPLRLSPSMVLGANEIAPLTMAASFATFASGGTYCQPVAITSVTDADGEEFTVPEAGCEERLDADVVNGLNHSLQQVVSESQGTGSAAALPGRSVAGKTGTANDNAAAWFVGYVPQLATAVWVGHSEEPTPMIGTTINGQYYPRVYSSVLPVPIWQRYMAQAVDGMSVEGFPEAEERYIHGDRVPVPNVVGWGIDGATRYLESEGFRVNVGDPVSNSWADDGDVGATEPISGTQVQPGSTITLRPSQSASNEDDSGDEDSGGGDNEAGSRGGGNADASGPGNSGSDRGNNGDESDPGERGNRGGGRGGD
ncbi:transglycosylase domain-containing protein [Pseudactinotalea sp. Z1748]|uniref:transglycosylase domain-containing protein n=1 Tax=Pseudactinotalea sp. Z1748 TaxID=3413027 RepID=UPI003C7CE225